MTDNDEMNNFIESVQQHGVMTPLIVRLLEGTTDEYEIISGHRRFRAAQKAELVEVPAFIRPVSRDGASILLVDSNLHCEHILLLEKIYAYKMRPEVLRHQGTSSQLEMKLRKEELMAQESGESRNQRQRYILLTKLIPDILNMVDEQRIAFPVGVELSYLIKYE